LAKPGESGVQFTTEAAPCAVGLALEQAIDCTLRLRTKKDGAVEGRLRGLRLIIDTDDGPREIDLRDLRKPAGPGKTQVDGAEKPTPSEKKTKAPPATEKSEERPANGGADVTETL